MYACVAEYCSFVEDSREGFAEDLPTLISGEQLQALCDVSWMDHERIRYHTSLSRTAVKHFMHETHHADHGHVVFVYTDLLPQFLTSILPHRTKPFVLVTHNSDDSILESHKTSILNHPLLLHMYSQNTHIRHPKLTALPIGIANAHWPHGSVENFQTMIRNARPFSQKKSRVYANVNKNTNLNHRSQVMNSVQRYPFVDMVPPNKGHAAYLAELSSYKWVVSPKGNGVDCHRLWECLYARCVPLLDDTENAREFKEMGFPVILVKDWNALSLDFLEKETLGLNVESYSSKLSLGYWGASFRSHGSGSV